MKKWKYLKGDESDFNGAPEWATIKTKSSDYEFFVEHAHKGARYISSTSSTGIVRTSGACAPEDDEEIVGHRQLVEDDEQDLNDCIGAPEARIKSGDLQVDGKWHSASIGDGDIPALIAERGSRYGKFKDGADIMQSLKDVMREVDGWNNLTASQKEALEMIQHKVGRILNGDPNYDDSWKDIAGYATLIVNELNGEIK